MAHARHIPRIMRRLTEWVGAYAQGVIRVQAPTWDIHEWNLARFLIARQGIGAYLATRLRENETSGVIPTHIRDWLERDLKRNTLRNQLLMAELEAILNGANRSGVGVMPLKGCYLVASSIYSQIGIRPMADLDLLIRPTDLAPMHAILSSLGYECISTTNSYSNHYIYLRPENKSVHSYQGEHPHNPRPVEVHTALRRPLWGDIKIVDLTEPMWHSSQPTHLLGYPVWVASNQMLLAHVCTHAMENLSLGKGRLIQLFDAISILEEHLPVTGLPYPEYIYPILELSRRVWGSQMRDIDMKWLAALTPSRLVRWCQTVPLDGRCGLAIDIESRRSNFANHWMRWRPAAWRLSLAYGDMPYWLSIWAHFRAMFRHAGKQIVHKQDPGVTARAKPTA